VLDVRGLRAAHGRVEVLHEVALRVAAGEVVCLLGANGAGKTTTVRCITGLHRPTAGEVRFEGRPIHRLPPDRLVRLGIGMVPERRDLFPELSVLDNLRLGAYTRRGRREIAADLERIYDLFPRLRERAGQWAGTLSGGEQQMVAIGRALMARPRLLLLDEPTLGLAPTLVQAIFETIATIRARGVTILLIEQNAHLALRLADRGYVLETGRVILAGPSAALMADPKVQESYLGGV
jgi:branched-chain amino acid transport system ATP-binding protein